MHSLQIDVNTAWRRIVDVTPELDLFCTGLGDGLVNAFVPHATVGLALMETGSGSESDLLAALERLLPRDNRYGHAHGSPGHGADHLLPAIVSPSVTLPVLGGRVAFGRLAVARPRRPQRRQPAAPRALHLCHLAL